MEGLTSSESWRERTSRELYERGGIRPYYSDDSCIVLLGDCRELLPLIGTVDLVLTDPPYGIGFAAQPTDYQRAKGFERKSWDNKPVDAELMAAVLAKGRDQIVWGGNYYSLPISRGWLAWTKPDSPPSMGSVEFAWTNLDQCARHISQSIAATNAERVGHPTQKPLAVIRWCLSLVPAAKTILDPFMGSGTTLRAAKDLGRKAIGIEIEERYCEIAAKRLAQAVLPLEIPA